jgi:hypothetical protein
MRETVMAFSPLALAVYFVLFPHQLLLCLQWLQHMLR